MQRALLLQSYTSCVAHSGRQIFVARRELINSAAVRFNYACDLSYSASLSSQLQPSSQSRQSSYSSTSLLEVFIRYRHVLLLLRLS